MAELQYCPKCESYKPLNEFRSESGNTAYSSCLKCRRAYMRSWMRSRRAISHQAVWSAMRAAFACRCGRCGYREFESALEFKSVQGIRNEHEALANLVNRYVYSASSDAWDAITNALKHHILLCQNCLAALRASDWDTEQFMADHPAATGPFLPLEAPPLDDTVDAHHNAR